jgi:C-terminal processing protease CtpA/Prc
VFVTVFDGNDSARRLTELMQASKGQQQAHGKSSKKGKQQQQPPSKKGGKKGKNDRGGGGDKAGGSKKNKGPVGRTVRTRACDIDQVLRARYRDWVEGNAERVHQMSNGRVGYVHVPDMVSNGFGAFYRYYLSEARRDGIIVDVRWNSGGCISDLLLNKLAQKPLAYDVPRYGEPLVNPCTVCGPARVLLCNEMTASDGECLSHGFQQQGMGPVVGRRTWGGTIGCDSYSLVRLTHTALCSLTLTDSTLLPVCAL